MNNLAHFVQWNTHIQETMEVYAVRPMQLRAPNATHVRKMPSQTKMQRMPIFHRIIIIQRHRLKCERPEINVLEGAEQLFTRERKRILRLTHQLLLPHRIFANWHCYKGCNNASGKLKLFNI
jgi:hypothetical protein